MSEPRSSESSFHGPAGLEASASAATQPTTSSRKPGNTTIARKSVSERYNAFVRRLNTHLFRTVGGLRLHPSRSPGASPMVKQSSAPQRIERGRDDQIRGRLRRQLLTDFTSVRDATCTNADDELRIRQAIAGQEDEIDNMIKNVIIQRGRGRWNASLASRLPSSGSKARSARFNSMLVTAVEPQAKELVRAQQLEATGTRRSC